MNTRRQPVKLSIETIRRNAPTPSQCNVAPPSASISPEVPFSFLSTLSQPPIPPRQVTQLQAQAQMEPGRRQSGRQSKQPSRFDEEQEVPRKRKNSTASIQPNSPPAPNNGNNSSSPLTSLDEMSPMRDSSPPPPPHPSSSSVLPRAGSSSSTVNDNSPSTSAPPVFKNPSRDSDAGPSKVEKRKTPKAKPSKTPKIAESDADSDEEAVVKHKQSHKKGKGKAKEDRAPRTSLENDAPFSLNFEGGPAPASLQEPAQPKPQPKQLKRELHQVASGSDTPSKKDGTGAPGTPAQAKSGGGQQQQREQLESVGTPVGAGEPPRKKPKTAHGLNTPTATSSPASTSQVAQPPKPKPGASLFTRKPAQKPKEEKKDGEGSGGLSGLKIKREPKKEKPAEPIQTPEERQAAIDQKRKEHREQVEADKKTAFDLLEQKMGMDSYESAFRGRVREMAKEDWEQNGKNDPDLPPLPRLTVYGSVFSLFPRDDEPVSEAGDGSAPANE